MSQDRRNFLKNVGTGAAAAAAVAKLSETGAAAQEAQAAKIISSARGSNQIKLALELDGEFSGWLQSFEGGDAVGDVIEFKDDSGATHKRIGSVKYQNIVLKSGFNMSKAFYEWIDNSFSQKGKVRRDGAIVAADYDYNTHAVLEFAGALITEFGLPACDGASKDASFLTLKFSPEVTQYKHSFGHLVLDDSHQKQEAFFSANFKFVIDGLDKACARVSKIDAISIKQSIIEAQAGGDRLPIKVPGKLEFPNLKITMPEIAADEFAAWHEDFVIKGQNGESKHKSGSLVYLNRTRQKELLTLSFKNLGIFKYAPEPKTADHKNTISEVKAEVYCEEISFKFGPVLE